MDKVLLRILPSFHFVSNKIIQMLYTKIGLDISKSAFLWMPKMIDTTNVHIGESSFINKNLTIYTGNGTINPTVFIGNNCDLGPNVTLICLTHRIGNMQKLCGEKISGDIIIEDGSWLGANVMVLPGVTIAKGCVIGAGAVVTKNTEKNGLYVGVPAKRKKNL